MLLGVVGTDVLQPTDGGIRVEVDWARDGYEGALDDVTALTRPVQAPLTFEYGRDQSSALSPTVAGRGGVTLDNSTRRFSPRNTASALYGLLKPARPVRVTRQIGSAVYGIFAGHTDDTPINPDLDSQTVQLALLDYLADFRGRTVTTPLHRDIRTGEAIGHILDACGWDADARDLDPGATVIPWWWEEGTDALEAMEQLVKSEGPPALLTIGPAGEVIFRDRHHRLTRTNALTSQGTWRGSGPVEPVMLRGFSYDEAWSKIINTATVNVDVRTLGELQEVWTSEATITLSAGEQQIIWIALDEPVTGAVVPSVAAGDFAVVTAGGLTVTLTRDSGRSMGVIFHATTNPAVVTALRLRAQPLTVAYTTQVSAVDVQSVSDYGARAYPHDLPWCGPGDALAVVEKAVALRSQPLPVVSARFLIGHNGAKATQLLGRDLSDRVTIIEPETAIAGDFYIESIRHELTGPEDHVITFGLEAVPNQPAATNEFRFDTSGSGFDQGVFSTGLDSAGLMFRFDTAGQGFNQAVFAA